MRRRGGQIVAYETPLDTAYTDKVLMLAEVLFPAPWTQGPIELNGAEMTEVARIVSVESPSRRTTRMYETPWLYPGSVQESRANALDSLEAGYNQVFHVGHGYRFNMHCADESIAIPEADALSHANRFFNLYMLNCTAAAFDYDCLAEHMLRNPEGGAVSIVGAVNSAFAEVSATYLATRKRYTPTGSASGRRVLAFASRAHPDRDARRQCRPVDAYIHRAR
jgi:hypothetical protein